MSVVFYVPSVNLSFDASFFSLICFETVSLSWPLIFSIWIFLLNPVLIFRVELMLFYMNSFIWGFALFHFTGYFSRPFCEGLTTIVPPSFFNRFFFKLKIFIHTEICNHLGSTELFSLFFWHRRRFIRWL